MTNSTLIITTLPLSKDNSSHSRILCVYKGSKTYYRDKHLCYFAIAKPGNTILPIIRVHAQDILTNVKHNYKQWIVYFSRDLYPYNYMVFLVNPPAIL